MADPRNFLLNTDYPMDKIAGYRTGSFNITYNAYYGWYDGGATLSHSHGVYPLCTLVWSFNANFSPSYTETSINDINGYQVTCSSTTSNIELYGFTWNGPATIYYKIFYFLPSDANVDVASTQSSLDNFVINTDYNYPKIFMDGSFTGTSTTINHNLGYYPMVDIWTLVGSSCRRIIWSNIRPSAYNGERLTTTTLSLFNGDSTTWWYRIYADEN